ncbi:MAG TPA: dTDP-4-dehydrorhamnose 3,5-epimerase family protein [candidate division Zixibacteria bacterium]|nr:dTDP-4-dehydrorhamnose 3,5-epimerase family protein [candidate division Zixibacteria bacterium]
MNQEIFEGVIVKRLTRHTDRRGWLIELFRSDEIEADYMPVMAYISMTHSGVVRGPHEHRDQADFFGFIGPSRFRLYLWDNRSDSNTFGKRMTLEAGEGDPAVVIVPAGVVHAYKNIGDVDGLVFNAPNRLYAGQGRGETVDEIRHEDDPASPFQVD